MGTYLNPDNAPFLQQVEDIYIDKTMLIKETNKVLNRPTFKFICVSRPRRFGKTIAGFFSDEPELGNGHLYFYENWLGTDQDLPFAKTMPAELAKRLGADWANRLYLLWENGMDADETAFVRHAYMDAMTKLLRENFSRQLGGWCREHGVKYIGHMIEDDNAHARTGSSFSPSRESQRCISPNPGR